MKNSTKWFLIILSILFVFGLGGSLLFYALVTSISQKDDDLTTTGFGDKVAIVELQGTITSSEEIVRQIKKLRDDRSVRALVFRVDSPGGGVVASQEIYEELKKTRDQMNIPVVVSMGSLAASGGYYVSCGGTRIVANPGTLTGSIGVISQFMRFDPLLDKIGIGVNTIKSGKMKDAGNPYREMTKEDKEYFQTLMDEVHHQFIHVVETERHIGHDTVVAFSDGRVFTGEQALQLGLVDTLGTYEDAVGIAAQMGGIKGKPGIVKERKRKPFSLFDLIFEGKVDDLLKAKDDILNQPILQFRMAQSVK